MQGAETRVAEPRDAGSDRLRCRTSTVLLPFLVGLLVHGVALAVGLSALLVASATAYTVVKLGGGAYLVYLGVQALLA